MRTRFGTWSGWLALICGLVAFSAVAAELRQWSDATGEFKIKAKFVALENGTVTLEKEDGEEIEIELKKFSTADQNVANDLAKAKDDDPFKSKTKPKDDPFKSKSKTTQPSQPTRPGRPERPARPGATKTAEPADDGDVPVIKLDWSKADVITLAPPEGGWKVELPKVEPPESSGKLKPITLPQKTNFFEGMNVAKGQALCLVGSQRRGASSSPTSRRNERPTRSAIRRSSAQSTSRSRCVPIEEPRLTGGTVHFHREAHLPAQAGERRARRRKGAGWHWLGQCKIFRCRRRSLPEQWIFGEHQANGLITVTVS